MTQIGRPAIFVDRDNTLIEDPGYMKNPDQVRLLPGAAAAVARLRHAGYPIIVVTNQSGIARGLLSEEDLNAIHLRLRELLAIENTDLDAIYYCPFLDGPDAVIEGYRCDSELRKPRPGMLLQAAGELDIDLSHSWMIGDSDRDIEAGRAAGCGTILIGGSSDITELQPDHRAPDLAAAADWLLDQLEPLVETTPDSTTQLAPSQSDPPSDDTMTQMSPSFTIDRRPDDDDRELPIDDPPGAFPATSSPEMSDPPSTGSVENPQKYEQQTRCPPEEHSQHPPPAVSSDEAAPKENLSPNLSGIEAALGEIIEELRTLKREQRFTEFSIAQLAGSIAQAFALCATGWGLYAAINDAMPSAQLRLLAAIAFQLMALTGFAFGRRK